MRLLSFQPINSTTGAIEARSSNAVAKREGGNRDALRHGSSVPQMVSHEVTRGQRSTDVGCGESLMAFKRRYPSSSIREKTIPIPEEGRRRKERGGAEAAPSDRRPG